MTYLAVYASVALIHLLAIASPGPTLMVVASHAVHGGRRAGFQVVLGVVAATLMWASLAVAGLGGVLVGVGWLYSILKVAAGAYLAWLGITMLRGAVCGRKMDVRTSQDVASGWRAVRTGFATNIANPKVIVYYASLFGAIIPSDAPPAVFFWVGLIALLVSTMWWSAVTLFFGLSWVRQGYARIRRFMDAGMGILLIVIAGRVLSTR